MQYRPRRYPTQFPIAVRTPTGPQKGEIIDVNQDGARLTKLDRLRRGDKIQLDVLSHWVDAVVVWTVRDQVGIMFRPKLGDHQMDTLRRSCDLRNAHLHGKVGFHFAELR